MPFSFPLFPPPTSPPSLPRVLFLPSSIIMKFIPLPSSPALSLPLTPFCMYSLMPNSLYLYDPMTQWSIDQKFKVQKKNAPLLLLFSNPYHIISYLKILIRVPPPPLILTLVRPPLKGKNKWIKSPLLYTLTHPRIETWIFIACLSDKTISYPSYPSFILLLNTFAPPPLPKEQ